VMYLGRIVEVGSADEIINDPKHPYTRILKWASLPLDPDDARETITDESPMMSEEAPDPRDPPSGCRFHPTCPKAHEVCTEVDPDLIGGEVREHRAACFREDSTHEYWDSESIHGGDREIPL